jgi:energy-coupling factor transporter transmembrane protein EcfT
MVQKMKNVNNYTSDAMIAIANSLLALLLVFLLCFVVIFLLDTFGYLAVLEPKTTAKFEPTHFIQTKYGSIRFSKIFPVIFIIFFASLITCLTWGYYKVRQTVTLKVPWYSETAIFIAVSISIKIIMAPFWYEQLRRNKVVFELDEDNKTKMQLL